MWKGTSGALVKLVDAIAFDFNPTLKIRVLDGFGSAQSRQKFSSPFTACCMDVAVAKTDMCIGDFWVTHGRLSMGISFLLPFGSDEFYVVAPRVEIMSSASWFNTMFDMLAAPWKPFTFDLWICFFAFIFFTSLVTLLTDGIFDVGDEFEDHEDTDDFENPTAVGMYCKSLYLNFLGYVSCSPMNAPSSVPGRLAALGFGWFLLIVISSYTANLAAILVEQKNPQNSIASIDDAIQQGRTICLVREIHKELTSKFPGAKLKLKLSTEAVIRGLKTKHCDVGVLTDQQIKKLFSGEYNERDCEKIENMTDAQAADLETGAVCIRDEDGNPDAKSDCGKFAKVGLPVVSVPLSMPVSDELQASFSYTYRKLQAEGEFNRMLKEEEARVAGKLGSACGLHSRDGDESLQLPLSSLAGTFIIAIFIQFVALLLSAIEYKSGKTLQEMLGLYNHVLDGHEERVRNRQQRAMEKSHALTVAEFEKFLVDFRKLEARLKDPEKPGASSAEGTCCGNVLFAAGVSSPIFLGFSLILIPLCKQRQLWPSDICGCVIDSTIPAIDAQAKGSTTDGRRVVHAGATSVHPIIADGNLQPQKVMDPKQTSSDFILMTSNSEAPHAVSQVQTVLSTPRTILPPPRSNPPSVHSERRWAHEEFTATAHGEFTPYVAQNGNVDGGLRSSDIRAYYSVSLANNSIPVSR